MPLDIGAEFCGNCGLALNPAQHPAPAHPQTAAAVQPQGETNFNGHATAALVLGVMAIPGMGFFPVGIPVSVAAITFGLLGRNSGKKARAKWGIVLGILGVIGAIVFFVIYLRASTQIIQGDPGSF